MSTLQIGLQVMEFRKQNITHQQSLISTIGKLNETVQRQAEYIAMLERYVAAGQPDLECLFVGDQRVQSMDQKNDETSGEF